MGERWEEFTERLAAQPGVWLGLAGSWGWLALLASIEDRSVAAAMIPPVGWAVAAAWTTWGPGRHRREQLRRDGIELHSLWWMVPWFVFLATTLRGPDVDQRLTAGLTVVAVLSLLVAVYGFRRRRSAGACPECPASARWNRPNGQVSPCRTV